MNVYSGYGIILMRKFSRMKWIDMSDCVFLFCPLFIYWKENPLCLKSLSHLQESIIVNFIMRTVFPFFMIYLSISPCFIKATENSIMIIPSLPNISRVSIIQMTIFLSVPSVRQDVYKRQEVYFGLYVTMMKKVIQYLNYLIYSLLKLNVMKMAIY